MEQTCELSEIPCPARYTVPVLPRSLQNAAIKTSLASLLLYYVAE
jgi:hypothetical protein